LLARARPASQPPAAPVPDDQRRIPDTLWGRIKPLLPPRPPHPLGCHNPRAADAGVVVVQRMEGTRWQQRSDAFPQRVGDSPSIIGWWSELGRCARPSLGHERNP
jgi:hypothetical protein